MSVHYDESEVLEQIDLALEVDSDSASVIVLGPNLDVADAAIFVVKGNTELRYVREMLVKQKLLTPGKPIDGEVP